MAYDQSWRSPLAETLSPRGTNSVPDSTGDASPETPRLPTAVLRSKPLTLRHGPYCTEQTLGRGGMATVHLARRANDREAGARFAVKRVAPEHSGSPSFTRMFLREAQLGSLLEHPNVVRVLDFGEQDGDLLLVTEYVHGSSCSRMLRAAAERREAMPIAVALYIACKILEALEYVHRAQHPDGSNLGVVHRDVSPGNILLGAMGEVKLADFGVALWEDSGNRETPPGAVLIGKAGYMSPEQVDGGVVDQRSDLFSLGVVLFEMLVGTPLFTGRNDVEILDRMKEGSLSPLSDVRATSIPFELRLILATAVARERVERFEDAREFSRALRAFARHAAVVHDRHALVAWLRRFDIWPLRSGTYAAVQVRPPQDDRTGAEWTERGKKPRD